MKTLRRWLGNCFASDRTPVRRKKAQRGVRPALEQLEDRVVPTVTYHGGFVLPHVEVETLFYGANWYNNATLYRDAGYLNTYLQTITNSSYMDMLTQAGYGVGRGQFTNGPISLANLGGSVDDRQIQSMLQGYINNGALQSPDSNRLYFVFVEPSVVVTAGGSNSVNNFLGYHSAFLGNDASGRMANIAYAVIPFAGGPNAQIQSLSDPLQSMTVVSSHELAEAVTDPQPSGIKGWFDDAVGAANQGEGEIGDIVNGQYVYWNGYAVQKEAGRNDQALTPQGTLVAQGQSVAANAGQIFNDPVASFSDGDNLGQYNSYQALINWGDGTSSYGQVVADGGGVFSVFGAHEYAQAGSYNVTVNIDDSNGTSAAAQSTASVARVIVPPPPTLGLVANSLTHSAEYYGDFVTAAYQRYLGRQPGAAEVSGWVADMQHGLTDEQVEASFIGSAEYIANHGGSGAGWITGMYQDLLGRTPAQQEVNGWLQAMASGVTPYQVAFGFAASAEREGIRVQNDYFTYLGRTASQAEVAGWVSAFGNGVTNEDVVAGFVRSDEYFITHGDTPGQWLDSAYQAVLGRQPDAAETNMWLSVL